MAEGWNYKETDSIQESHGNPLYCASFNSVHPAHPDLFATVGRNTATVYRVSADSSAQALQHYEDENEAEEFYVCSWSVEEASGTPLLLLAGKEATLRVVDVSSGVLLRSLGGHGQPVNDVTVHPTEPWVAATASKDQTLRVWNLATGCCVLQLQGVHGHTNEVLTADWRTVGGSGDRRGPNADWTLVSAGMDSCVLVWDLSPHWEALAGSRAWVAGSSREYPVHAVRHPVFSSAHVHASYVDCVRWLGRLLITKSTDNRARVWRIDTPAGAAAALLDHASGHPSARQPSAAAHASAQQAVLVQELVLEGCAGVWWLRFALGGPSGGVLAIGSATGQVRIYDAHAPQSEPMARLKPRKAAALVRQTAVSACGRWVVAAHDDGVLTLFSRVDAGGKGA